MGRVNYQAKNNPWMREESAPRLRFVHVDEFGNELKTPEQIHAVRHGVKP
jgi:hypothetical protein